MKISSKIGYMLLGVLFTVIVGVVGILIWNPQARLEREKKWYNDRIYGSTDLFNKDLAKISDARMSNYDNWQKLGNEFDTTRNEAKLVAIASDVRDGMSKVSTLADQTCSDYKSFIMSDPIDAKQRGKDADKLCQLLGGFKDALALEEKSLQGMLNKTDSVDNRASKYREYTGQADQKIISTLKQIGEFQTSPLKYE